MFDAHIHLYDPAFADGIASFLADAEKTGVQGWLSNSINISTWKRTLFLSRSFPGIKPAFGIHPWKAEESLPDRDILDTIADAAAAIGEIGLDSHCDIPMELQIIRFREQLKLAQDFNLPVVIHARASWDLLFSELQNYKVSGMVHNFSGSIEIAALIIKKGFYLSLGTALLRSPGQKFLRTVRELPLDRLLIETDAPAMPFEDCLNVPANLSGVAAALAEIRGIKVCGLADETQGNLQKMLEG